MFEYVITWLALASLCRYPDDAPIMSMGVTLQFMIRSFDIRNDAPTGWEHWPCK